MYVVSIYLNIIIYHQSRGQPLSLWLVLLLVAIFLFNETELKDPTHLYMVS